jgi:ribosomal protein S12 methylthiotransferase accessory factor
MEEAGFVTQPERKIDIGQLPDLSNDNIKVEVENCISALSRIKMEVILVDVMSPELGIPAFYTIIPGAHFRERAAGTSVGMFSAKLISDSDNPRWAIRELKKMDRALPGKYYVKFFLGVGHISIYQPSKALEYLEEALDLGPKEEDIPSIYSYMGVCLKDLERYREGIKVLEKGQEYDKERTDIYNLMGFCHFKLKEHEKAIECFREVLKLDPGSAIDYANIASNYRDMGDRENAIRHYRMALELDPTIDFARENLFKLGHA